ncbi:uncharacterized mitochondrial protein-like protein [Tanacetum coccineum]|uniref:Uncharacterized mitochondrial protein-like protein n=1 Tax=Tanacetum coccineum TaxID=301880 RepID=A0ABQ5A9B5_9ASTR
MAHSNVVIGIWGSAVKTLASYNWRNSRPNFHYNSGPTFIRTVNANSPQGRPKPAKAWVPLRQMTDPFIGTSEQTNNAGTSQTPKSNASKEKDEDVELIVVPSSVMIPGEIADSRTSSTNQLCKLEAIVQTTSGVSCFFSVYSKAAKKQSQKITALLFSLFSISGGNQKIAEALQVDSWVSSHAKKKLLQFIVPTGVVGGIKPRLVAQGYTGRRYWTMMRFFDPVGKIEAIDEEVYVSQPPGFVDPDHPNKISDFLGLQVKQNKGGIFISQDKYVAEILKKFELVNVKAAITPMETKVPLTKDEEAIDVDVHLYRSMIGSLMYLTAFRPDIMYAVCVCSRFQYLKVLHISMLSRGILQYHKGKPKLAYGILANYPSYLEAILFLDSEFWRSILTGNPLQLLQLTVDKYLGSKSIAGLWFQIVNTKINIDMKHNMHCEDTRIIIPASTSRFTEIVDFLRGSDLRYALTSNPTIYDSLVQQFWQTATPNTIADGTLEINATIDTIRQDKVFDVSLVFCNMILRFKRKTKHLYQAVSSDQKESFGEYEKGCSRRHQDLYAAMLLVASTNPNAGQEHDAVTQPQPSSSTPPVPSKSSPPVQSPPPISTPTPTPILETEPAPFEHTFEEPSPVHQHFSPPQEQALRTNKYG